MKLGRIDSRDWPVIEYLSIFICGGLLLWLVYDRPAVLSSALVYPAASSSALKSDARNSTFVAETEVTIPVYSSTQKRKVDVAKSLLRDTGATVGQDARRAPGGPTAAALSVSLLDGHAGMGTILRNVLSETSAARALRDEPLKEDKLKKAVEKYLAEASNARSMNASKSKEANQKFLKKTASAREKKQMAKKQMRVVFSPSRVGDRNSGPLVGFNEYVITEPTAQKCPEGYAGIADPLTCQDALGILGLRSGARLWSTRSTLLTASACQYSEEGVDFNHADLRLAGRRFICQRPSECIKFFVNTTPPFFRPRGLGPQTDGRFNNPVCGEIIDAQFWRHPCRVDDPTVADVIVACCPLWPRSPGPQQQLVELPPRPPARPYVLIQNPTDKIHTEILARGDIIFSGHDLREWTGNATAQSLPGITFPTYRLLKGGPRNIERGARFFLTFKGADHSSTKVRSTHTRLDFAASLMGWNPQRNDVKICVGSPKQWESKFKCAGSASCCVDGSGPRGSQVYDYNTLMGDTSFALVPGGHGRWSYRLTEAIQCCTVPVIMADGLTMPFETLIDWNQMSVRVPEAMAKRAPDVIAALPNDQMWIRRRREEMCRLSQLYFENSEKRVNGFLKAARAWVRQHRGEPDGIH